MLKKLLLTGLTIFQLAALQAQIKDTTAHTLADALTTEQEDPASVPKWSGKVAWGVAASQKIGNLGPINTWYDNSDEQRTRENGYNIIDNADVQVAGTRNWNPEHATTASLGVQGGNFAYNNYGGNEGATKYLSGAVNHTHTNTVLDSLGNTERTDVTAYTVGRVASPYGDPNFSSFASSTNFSTTGTESSSLAATVPYLLNEATVSISSAMHNGVMNTLKTGVQQLDDGHIGRTMSATFQEGNHTVQLPVFADFSGLEQGAIVAPTYTNTLEGVKHTTRWFIGTNLQLRTTDGQQTGGMRGAGGGWSRLRKQTNGNPQWKVTVLGDIGQRGQQAQVVGHYPLSKTFVATIGVQGHNAHREQIRPVFGGHIGFIYTGSR